MSVLLDQHGNPITPSQNEGAAIQQLQARFQREFSLLKAKYDAAATTDNNTNHWANADYLDPHTSAQLSVRRLLRSRSRYEIIENNPYLKGCILTTANDFMGTGFKLQITDKALSRKTRKVIEDRWKEWCEASDIYRKIWRMRVAKLVDGETFAFGYSSKRRKLEYRDMPISLDLYVTEADRITSPIQAMYSVNDGRNFPVELDGVRWDEHEQATQYYLLDNYPGNYVFLPSSMGGKWFDADNVIHWFRQERGWLRGIPELTPSLPLCALLRRYTLAVVRAAEYAACFSGLLESDIPPGVFRPQGTQQNVFETFPVEHGMFTVLPWGYKLKQLEGTQPMAVFNQFVDAILREIVRPIHMPFNLAAGTSKDANMSSALLDVHVYKGGQQFERQDCERTVLSQLFVLWYQEARLIDGYLPREARIRRQYPSRCWRWDKIGLDHTDPVKVAEALKIAHDKGFLTDTDIQEREYNRSIEEWQEDLDEQMEYRKKQNNLGMNDALPQNSNQDNNPAMKEPKTETKAKKSPRRNTGIVAR